MGKAEALAPTRAPRQGRVYGLASDALEKARYILGLGLGLDLSPFYRR
ncbi:hypothetical protein GCM10017767_07450 [Halomonas urumqiensis]|nr:hypothetical protein GCM10017767_07450 [Halomonas urumqiensis]